MKKAKELSYETIVQSINNGGYKIEFEEKFCFTTSYGTKYSTKSLELYRTPIKCPGLFNKMVAYKQIEPLFLHAGIDFNSLKKEFPKLTIIAKNISYFWDVESIFCDQMVAFFIFSW